MVEKNGARGRWCSNAFKKREQNPTWIDLLALSVSKTTPREAEGGDLWAFVDLPSSWD